MRGKTAIKYAPDVAEAFVAASVGVKTAVNRVGPFTDGFHEHVAVNETVLLPTQPPIDLPLLLKVTLPSTLAVAVRDKACREMAVFGLPDTDSDKVVLALKFNTPFLRSTISAAVSALV